MTEQEFTELAEKHLTALQSYKMDKNGNFPIEIFGIEKLYKQLTLTDVSHRRELLSEYENFKLIKQDLLQSRNEFINEFLKERNCG